ncbi:unnamed protein product, partial [Sphacelaria rigidula]
AVDSTGNLILAGFGNFVSVGLDDDTFVSELSGDFQAVKLSGLTGAKLWTWNDSSALSAVDVINAAAVDSEGNVVLGGFTEGDWDGVNSNQKRDMAVVKLDGDTGDEIWTYQDAADDLESSSGLLWPGITTILDVAVDTDDNVFLFGETSNELVPGKGAANDFDWFVRKLDGATAAALWTVQGGSSVLRDITRGIKVDPAGDVVTAGYTGDDDLAITVKKLRGDDGEIIWEFDRFSLTSDALNSVDVDADGNVYVAGGEGAENLQGHIAEHATVLKIDGQTGAEIWYYSGAYAFPGRSIFNAVAVDPVTGYVVGAGGLEGTSSYDMVAVVLDGQTGDELLVYQDGTSSGDIIKFAGFDSQGHLFFGGNTYGQWTEAAGSQDFLAVKFETLENSEMPSPTVKATPSPTTPIPSPAVSPTPSLSTLPPSGNEDGFVPLLTPTPSLVGSFPSPITATKTPTVQATPSPIALSRAPITSPILEPASEGDSGDLATWEIGTIASGGGLFVLMALLGLCEC